MRGLSQTIGNGPRGTLIGKSGFHIVFGLESRLMRDRGFRSVLALRGFLGISANTSVVDLVLHLWTLSL